MLALGDGKVVPFFSSSPVYLGVGLDSLRQGLVIAQASLEGNPPASNSQTLRSQCSPSCSVCLESFNNGLLRLEQILAARPNFSRPFSCLFYFIGIVSFNLQTSKVLDFLFPFVPTYNVATLT